MDYPILEGENPEVTIGSETEVRVRSEGAFSNFIAIDIDDNDVGSENYTKEEGSTIITLSKSYVQTLSAGTHTINFHFTNGKSSTNLVIKAAPVVTPAPTPTPTATATITQPQTTTAVTTPVEESRTITIPLTSDQSDLAAWMGMLMISISGMIISLVLNNKKLFR